jgi:hypothetical protein
VGSPCACPICPTLKFKANFIKLEFDTSAFPNEEVFEGLKVSGALDIVGAYVTIPRRAAIYKPGPGVHLIDPAMCDSINLTVLDCGDTCEVSKGQIFPPPSAHSDHQYSDKPTFSGVPFVFEIYFNQPIIINVDLNAAAAHLSVALQQQQQKVLVGGLYLHLEDPNEHGQLHVLGQTWHVDGWLNVPTGFSIAVTNRSFDSGVLHLLATAHGVTYNETLVV